MSYPRYLEYRDSGVKWLGEVPTYWDVQRQRNVVEVLVSNVDKHAVEGEQPVRLCNYVDVYKNERITSAIPFLSATATSEEVRRFTLRAGDVIITKDSESWDDIAVPAFVQYTAPDLLCGYHLAILRAPEGIMSGSYVFRVHQSQPVIAQYQVSANGITRYGLSHSAIKSVLLPVPPLCEQVAIAAFLDREAARIDALIAKQERLIALLQEKRQALISHAVTRGVDPHAPMKDSGVAWLGEIPAHWEVRRLKRLAEVRTGVAKGRDLGSARKISVPYLRVANVQDGFIDITDVATIEILEGELDRYLLRPGDVLMNEGGDNDKLGRGAIWHGEIAPCIHQNHVFAVRPTQIESTWLNAITGSDYAKFYFYMNAKQSTNLASISSSNLREIPIVLPPSCERVQILSFIESETAKIDTLISKSQQAIALLREHRVSLITAAVTGKIDVRSFVTAEAMP